LMEMLMGGSPETFGGQGQPTQGGQLDASQQPPMAQPMASDAGMQQ
jgi:hypothetical protein